MALDRLKTRLKGIFPVLVLYYWWKDRDFSEQKINRIQKAFYHQFISSGERVFDVGANVGQRSKIYQALGADVVGYEPQPYCIRHLRARFLNTSSFTLREIGLSKKAGRAPMFVSSSHTLSTLSKEYTEEAGRKIFKNDSWDQEIEIETSTLDLEIKRFGPPAFVKIDVEGFEFEVLQGLSQPVKGLSFEFIPNEETAWKPCLERLNQISAKYRFNYTLGEALEFQLEHHVDYQTIISNQDLPKEKSFGDIYAFIVDDEDNPT